MRLSIVWPRKDTTPLEAYKIEIIKHFVGGIKGTVSSVNDIFVEAFNIAHMIGLIRDIEPSAASQLQTTCSTHETYFKPVRAC